MEADLARLRSDQEQRLGALERAAAAPPPPRLPPRPPSSSLRPRQQRKNRRRRHRPGRASTADAKPVIPPAGLPSTPPTTPPSPPMTRASSCGRRASMMRRSPRCARSRGLSQSPADELGQQPCRPRVARQGRAARARPRRCWPIIAPIRRASAPPTASIYLGQALMQARPAGPGVQGLSEFRASMARRCGPILSACFLPPRPGAQL